MHTSALVLFSGGQDSTTCLAHALSRYERVETLAFDYGQRHKVELDARLNVLAAIKARQPDLPVLILSGFAETHYATTLLRQGASGYLNKDCDPEEIVKAIRTVARGRKYITAGVAERLGIPYNWIETSVLARVGQAMSFSQVRAGRRPTGK